MRAVNALALNVAHLLDYLRPKLPLDGHEFHVALLAAINDPAQVPALDRFSEWRDTPPLPLDAHDRTRARSVKLGAFRIFRHRAIALMASTQPNST